MCYLLVCRFCFAAVIDRLIAWGWRYQLNAVILEPGPRPRASLALFDGWRAVLSLRPIEATPDLGTLKIERFSKK